MTRPPTAVQPLPLVLVPGLLCTAELWHGQVEELAGRVEPLVPDVSAGTSVEELAHSVLALAPRRFALAGLSMGGYVALEVARAAPERVLGLALFDTNARPDAPEARTPREELIALAEEGRFEEVPRRLIPRLLAPPSQSDLVLIEVIERMAKATGPASFVRQQRAIMSRPDAREGLAELRVPALVLCGEEDLITPPDHHREMAALVPGAELEIIGNCGHMSTLEEPLVVAAAMERWLGRVEVAASL